MLLAAVVLSSIYCLMWSVLQMLVSIYLIIEYVIVAEGNSAIVIFN
jgi:hypothetical protein